MTAPTPAVEGLNLDGLRAKAEKATPGPWRWAFPGSDSPELTGIAGDVNYSYETEVLTMAPVECMSHCYGGSSRMNLEPNDAAFIAAADPSTVLALIARVEAAEAAVARVRVLHRPRTDDAMSLVDWSYCTCGAMETFTASDGYPSLGPARYPCKTVRALDGTS